MPSDNRFRFTGIECVRFAVEDLDAACRFASDWGLTYVASVNPEVKVFRAVDGSEVQVVAADPARAERAPDWRRQRPVRGRLGRGRPRRAGRAGR